MAGIVTGKNADIKIASSEESLYGMSDFSLTIDRGTVEQDLVGAEGNASFQGALSIDGSYTNCKFAASGSADSLEGIISGTTFAISGAIDSGDGSTIGWYLKSCQVTGYDVSIGDASTISEASIDFTVLDPYNVTYSTGWIED